MCSLATAKIYSILLTLGLLFFFFFLIFFFYFLFFFLFQYWDVDLERVARNYAKECTWKDTPNRKYEQNVSSSVIQNLFYTTGERLNIRNERTSALVRAYPY